MDLLTWHLYFTNLLSQAAVKQLAEADMQEVVKEVKEIYIDYLPIGGTLHNAVLPLCFYFLFF